MAVKPAIMANVHERLGERRGMPTHSNAQHLDQVMETFFVGSAMKDVSANIMDRDLPVRARHMRSIDDLLMHVEDNDVQCAVVDQSLPTESRGVKLVLLAGIHKVKHLIVVAPPNNRTGIASIDGVHKVLCGPASLEQITEAVLEQTRPAAPKSVAATGHTLAARAVGIEKTRPGARAVFAKHHETMSAIASRARHKLSLCNLAGLGNRMQTRPAMATVASAFVALSTIAALSLASGGSVTSVSAGGQPAMTEMSPVISDGRAKQPHLTRQSQSALEAAGLSRRDAASRRQASLRTIELEYVQQREFRQELLAHISRLNSLLTELSTARGNDRSRKSGKPAAFNTHKRLAEVKIELALQELELSRVDSILANLDVLKTKIDPLEHRPLKLADISSTGISN